MSRPDPPLFLSPRVENDFADVLQHTLETWGEEQVMVYRAELDKARRNESELAINRPRLARGRSRRVLHDARRVVHYDRL